MARLLNSGEKFGRLTVKGPTEKTKRKREHSLAVLLRLRQKTHGDCREPNQGRYAILWMLPG